MALSDFDLDFRKGVQGENRVERAVQGMLEGTIEVKTDFQWKRTGNIYVETECFYQRHQDWRPSGLSVSKSDLYSFVLNDMIITIPTPLLKEVVKAHGRAIECRIEPNQTKGYLIKLSNIVEAVMSQ